MSTTGRAEAPAEDDAARRSREDRRWRLEDRRDFLVRSLADLWAERGAGDIAPADFGALVARDEERLGVIEAELRDLDAEEAAARAAGSAAHGTDEGPAGSPPRARRRRRRWLGLVAVVALTAGTTLLVVHLASPRLPGQPETGGARLNLSQEIRSQLAQASTLVNQATPTSLSEALALYRTVLAEDPVQPEALAETGWLEWEAGVASSRRDLESAGRTLVQRSLRIQPDDYGAHLFLGTMDLEGSHDAAAAVVQYRAFLAEHPPADEVAQAAPLIRRAFAQAGRPVPGQVAAG